MIEPFLEAVPEVARDLLPSEDVVAGWLTGSLERARAAWPRIELPATPFARHVGRKVGALPVPSTFRELRTEELYLACACLEGNDVALATFEAEYTARLAPPLRRLHLTESAAQDLLSTLRERLFFARDDRAPMIADYSGRGALFAWLRSIAVHAALKVKRRAGRDTDLGTAFELAAPEANPEVAYLKRRYAADFKGSLERAFRVVTPRERNLLRQHYFDALTIDDLGVLYRVHRATAARWLADARKSVLKAVRADLVAKLALSETDVEALWASAQSDLEASISRLLGPGPQGAG